MTPAEPSSTHGAVPRVLRDSHAAEVKLMAQTSRQPVRTECPPRMLTSASRILSCPPQRIARSTSGTICFSGTHSTPSYLVDYIVGRLAPWIEQLDQDKRSVFEPACGPGAFLIAAIRLLTSLLPSHDDATECQFCEVPGWVQVAPESVDV